MPAVLTARPATMQAMETANVSPLPSTSYSLKACINQKCSDEKKKKKETKSKEKKRKEKMGIVNFFVLGMFQWIGCRSWISAEFLVPLLDAGFAKWSKCGLGYEYPSCV